MFAQTGYADFLVAFGNILSQVLEGFMITENTEQSKSIKLSYNTIEHNIYIVLKKDSNTEDINLGLLKIIYITNPTTPKIKDIVLKVIIDCKKIKRSIYFKNKPRFIEFEDKYMNKFFKLGNLPQFPIPDDYNQKCLDAFKMDLKRTISFVTVTQELQSYYESNSNAGLREIYIQSKLSELSINNNLNYIHKLNSIHKFNLYVLLKYIFG